MGRIRNDSLSCMLTAAYTDFNLYEAHRFVIQFGHTKCNLMFTQWPKFHADQINMNCWIEYVCIWLIQPYILHLVEQNLIWGIYKGLYVVWMTLIKQKYATHKQIQGDCIVSLVGNNIWVRIIPSSRIPACHPPLFALMAGRPCLSTDPSCVYSSSPFFSRLLVTPKSDIFSCFKATNSIKKQES